MRSSAAEDCSGVEPNPLDLVHLRGGEKHGTGGGAGGEGGQWLCRSWYRYRSGCLGSPAQIRLVRLEGREVCLIDSGSGREAGRKVLDALFEDYMPLWRRA